MKNQAFTLIELLVVVLIIGILAAIAVPQYQKAVYKSRSAQLYTATKSVYESIKSYELATGKWPTNFDQLDINLPLENGSGSICGLAVASSGITNKKGKGFAIVLGTQHSDNNNYFDDVFGVFTEGPYKCSGFAFVKIMGYDTDSKSFEGNELLCVEEVNAVPSGFTRGDFCTKVMGIPFYKYSTGVNYFK